MTPLYILRGIPLFKNLEDDDLKLIAGKLDKESYAKGEFVFKEGDVGDTMYLVESGQVAVKHEDTNEAIAYLGPGSFFGEMSLLPTPKVFTAPGPKTPRFAALSSRLKTPGSAPRVAIRNRAIGMPSPSLRTSARSQGGNALYTARRPWSTRLGRWPQRRSGPISS